MMSRENLDDLIYKVVGAAMTLHTTIGYGLREKTYERALCVELDRLGICHSQQSVYPVLYRGLRSMNIFLTLRWKKL